MAGSKVALKGANKAFTLSESLKKYTLMDYGFQQSKQGNFEFERRVSASFNDSREVLFKMKVNADLKQFTMNVTNLNGMQQVNLYKNESMQPLQEAVEALQADLVENNVLDQVQ